MFLLFSCESESLNSQVENSSLNESTVDNSTTAKKVIFYASWDEWGRASRDCDGWGLCNFYSCWFCEEPGQYSGKVEVDDITNEGFLYITLDPTESIQNDAILGESIFYVDEDIDNSIATIHRGEYDFDSTIGEYGGYKIDITVK